MVSRPDYFIGCDWGTTNLRARLVRVSDCAVLSQHTNEQGAGRIATQYPPGAGRISCYQNSLEAAIAALEPNDLAADPGTPIVISGMASASIGWKELTYAETPLPLDGTGLIVERLREPHCKKSPSGRDVFLVSGVRTTSSSGRMDVMRGEETELIGLLQQTDLASLRNECLVVLPGTHSKHLYVRGQQLLGFQTFLTGELYEVIVSHSILRHSVEPHGASTSIDDDADRASFTSGVRASQETPLLGSLFQVRTRQLLISASPRENSLFLSGLLIGSELIAAISGSLLPDGRSITDVPVLLYAGAALSPKYLAASKELGIKSLIHRSPDAGVPPSVLGQRQVLADLPLVAR